MNYERSAGAIIFRRGSPPQRNWKYARTKADAAIHFLLVRYRSANGGHWDFARGHVEEGEQEYDAARREIQEETGIRDLRFARGFRAVYCLNFTRDGKPIVKDVVMFLAETHQGAVRISEEHLGYVWVTYRDALPHFRFPNSKTVLRKAQGYLQKMRVERGSISPPPSRRGR